MEEETGLSGSKALDLSTLQSRQAVVLDSNGAVGIIVSQAPASRSHRGHGDRQGGPRRGSPGGGDQRLVAARALAGMRLGRIDLQTTANFGVIGGTASNVVPERVELGRRGPQPQRAYPEAQTRHMVTSLEEPPPWGPGPRSRSAGPTARSTCPRLL